MDSEAVHRAGSKHKATDALSRLKTTEEEDRALDDALMVPFVQTAMDDASEDETFSADNQSTT